MGNAESCRGRMVLTEIGLPSLLPSSGGSSVGSVLGTTWCAKAVCDGGAMNLQTTRPMSATSADPRASLNVLLICRFSIGGDDHRPVIAVSRSSDFGRYMDRRRGRGETTGKLR